MVGVWNIDVTIDCVGLYHVSPSAAGSLRAWALKPSGLREHNNMCTSLVHTKDNTLYSDYIDGRWLVNLKKLSKEGLFQKWWPHSFKTRENAIPMLFYSLCLHVRNGRSVHGGHLRVL